MTSIINIMYIYKLDDIVFNKYKIDITAQSKFNLLM